MSFTWCNSKTQVFEGATNSKSNKNTKKMFPKKIPEWIGYKTIDPICYF